MSRHVEPHDYHKCRDLECPLPYCRIWKEALAVGFERGYWKGFADGEAAGFAAGMAAAGGGR